MSADTESSTGEHGVNGAGSGNRNGSGAGSDHGAQRQPVRPLEGPALILALQVHCHQWRDEPLYWQQTCLLLRQLCRASTVLLVRRNAAANPTGGWELAGSDRGDAGGDGWLLQTWPAATQELGERALQNGFAFAPMQDDARRNRLLVVVRPSGIGEALLLIDLPERERAALNEIVVRALLAAHFPAPPETPEGSPAGAAPPTASAPVPAVDDGLLALLELSTQVMEEERFAPAALALVNGIAAHFQASQVALGWRDGDSVRAVAISHLDRFERNTENIPLLEDAFIEALGYPDGVRHHAGDSDATLLAHARLSAELGLSDIRTLPLGNPAQDDGGAAAVLLIGFAGANGSAASSAKSGTSSGASSNKNPENNPDANAGINAVANHNALGDTEPVTAADASSPVLARVAGGADARAALPSVVSPPEPSTAPLMVTMGFVLPWLQVLRLRDRWWGARLAHWSAGKLQRWFGPGRVGPRIAAVAASLLLLFAIFGTWDYRIEAMAQMTTDHTRLISAQFDGRVDQVFVSAGDVVPAGAPMALLDTRELRQQEIEVGAERQRLSAEADKARAAGNLAELEIAQARLAQVNARLGRVQHYLQQAQLVAPFAGVVVEGERKDLMNAPVKKGDRLFRLARIDGLYMEMMVPERDIRYVKPDATGVMRLLARPDTEIPFKLMAFIPMAQVKGQEGNHFLIKAQLLQTPEAWWRPGMSGIVLIDGGRQNVTWILTHKMVDTLRMKLWWLW